MSVTTPASRGEAHQIQHPPPAEPIAVQRRTLAELFKFSTSHVSKRKDQRTLAFLDLPERLIRFLNGDYEVLQPWGSRGIKPPAPGEDGRTTLDHSFPGRRTLTIADVAFSIDVSAKTVQRWIHVGELPAEKIAGRWQIDRDVFVAWLLALRVPARWEVDA